MRVLSQRKLLIGVVVLTTILTAFVSTKLVSPRYESASTLALTPKNASNDLLLFGTLDAIVPVYANAADARDTLDLAKNAIGGQLASVTVETFKGTGIMKIRARSTSPSLAQRTAEGVASALIQRTQTGAVGIPSLRLTELESAGLPTTPVFPRTKLTLLVAAILGLAFGVGAALLRENLTTRVESADDLARSSGVPVFAEVPVEAAIPTLHSAERLKRDPRFRIVAEAFRDLRTNLLFSDDSISSILITSPDGSHGKTTVSFGLDRDQFELLDRGANLSAPGLVLADDEHCRVCVPRHYACVADRDDRRPVDDDRVVFLLQLLEDSVELDRQELAGVPAQVSAREDVEVLERRSMDRFR
jgi:capsular polysaccharide biosynthesis protein